MKVPTATGIGPAGVSTGFGRMPESAVAQLAAIDQAAMESVSLTGGHALISSWAVPGGLTPSSWSVSKSMTELLNAAELPSTGSPQLSVRFVPAMGLIKGRVGDDYVVACVDYVAETAMHATATAAVADCQRMTWVKDHDQTPGLWPMIVSDTMPSTGALVGIDWLSGGTFSADPIGWTLANTAGVSSLTQNPVTRLRPTRGTSASGHSGAVQTRVPSPAGAGRAVQLDPQHPEALLQKLGSCQPCLRGPSNRWFSVGSDHCPVVQHG
ncbi:hypothetical protein [Kineosporia sp. NBRC 101731]|uniref:hypothetical protein n=1 Tax=Kineosporia sp. NBRC 101731 TaxID=3032199 RepID=UPI0025540DF1|nr:hypothetical protein [Kineosporia sp. NBRC 101731]